MSVVYKLSNYIPTLVFEKEHHKNIRWDNKYKLWMLEENNKCQGIWIKEKDKLVGEIILSWDSSNVLAIESITVLPDYRRKGIGTTLVEKALDWGEGSGYQFLIGEAKISDSWQLFSKMGALSILTYKNWSDTGDDYMFFKMNTY